MKDYSEALRCYQTAEFMCPVRVAPLEGMLNVYLAMNNTTKVDSIRTIIQNKDIKVPSSTIVEIKRNRRRPIQSELPFLAHNIIFYRIITPV
jgi:hypothetical protein